MKPDQTRPSNASRNGRATRVWIALLTGFTTALGCSLLTSLDFVGSPRPSDAGTAAPDAEIPDAARPDAARPDASDCDQPCAPGRICIDGECSCPGGTSECNGACVESLEDAGYCGTCGNTCRQDQHCSDAGCACELGQTDCGTACADLKSDLGHCGACGTSCQVGQLCIQGACKSSPCDDLCANPQVLPSAREGFRKEGLGTEAFCFSVKGYQPTLTNPRIVCWNFENGRTLTVNGRQVECLTDPGYALDQDERGWYCIQGSAGGSPYAGFLLPTNE